MSIWHEPKNPYQEADSRARLSLDGSLKALCDAAQPPPALETRLKLHLTEAQACCAQGPSASTFSAAQARFYVPAACALAMCCLVAGTRLHHQAASPRPAGPTARAATPSSAALRPEPPGGPQLKIATAKHTPAIAVAVGRRQGRATLAADRAGAPKSDSAKPSTDMLPH